MIPANQRPIHSFNLLSQDGTAVYYPALFTEAESQLLMQSLLTEIDWQEAELTMFGKKLKIPRLQAWHGDAGMNYTYSGINLQALPWTDSLMMIKERIGLLSEVTYNSVLLNLYRDGSDSMGWHSDDEPELGPLPTIGSVSFGAARMFHLKHKTKPLPVVKQQLENGSFLLMKEEIQDFWKHQIPKTKKPLKPRINLTFRVIK